jgi:hypothetical protein
MISAVSAQSILPPTPLTPRAVLDAWRSITRGEVVVTFLLGSAVFVYHFIMLFGRGGRWLQSSLAPDKLVQLFVLNEISAFALLLAIVVADRVTGKDPRRQAAYALAVLVGSAAGAILVSMALKLVWNMFAWELANMTWSVAEARVVTFRIGYTLYVFFEWLVIGGAATFIYTDRRRARMALARMRAAELERVRTAKRVVESRLQAMQARVEPQFLFNTLAQVKRLYELDAKLAERMLSDLIAYLRAAMPQMRDTSSTLGQELELARAYLDIVKVRLGDRLTFDIEVPEGAGDARMPPMMLLPLIDHAVVHGLAAKPQAGAMIQIVCAVTDDRLSVTVVDSGAGFVSETGADGIASIRERLTALYGANARLDLRQRSDQASEAVMEIPCELADASVS